MQKLKPKNNYLSLIVGLVIALGAMYALRSCNTKQSSADDGALPGDTLVVAIEYSPFSFYSYGDTLGGFNYEMIKAIADSHNLHLKFQPITSLVKSLEQVNDNKIDLLIADLPMTTGNREIYEFLEPAYTDRHVLVQRKDSVSGDIKVKNQLDLAEDTVWIVEGSFIKERIDNLAAEIGDTIYTNQEPVPGSEQLFMLVADGKVKQAVVPENVAKAMAKQYPDIDISTNISFDQFQSWIISERHAALRDSLNKWIAEYKKSPAYQALIDRYTGE